MRAYLGNMGNMKAAGTRQVQVLLFVPHHSSRITLAPVIHPLTARMQRARESLSQSMQGVYIPPHAGGISCKAAGGTATEGRCEAQHGPTPTCSTMAYRAFSHVC